MTFKQAFRLLGIDPTTETALIRRAYAQRLKAMDVDADVDGYAKLRDARDVALSYASGSVDEFVEAPEDLSDELQDQAASPPESEADSADQPLDEISSAQHRLIAILFPQTEEMYHLSAEEADEALRCFEVLKTDPRLEQIEILSSAMDWFAQILAQSAPRSDPLVRPTVEYFGWNRSQQVGVNPAVAMVVARADALDHRDQLQQRSHRHHRAWKELTKPANENSKRGWVSAKRVSELMRDVRTRYPTLEADMDWYRVDLWESAGSDNIARYVGKFVIVLLIVAFNVVRNFSEDSLPPPASASSVESVFSRSLTTVDDDMTQVLAAFTAESENADARKLQARNPKLYDLLAITWQSTKDRGENYLSYAKAVDLLLGDLVKRSWASAPYSVLDRKLAMDVQIAENMGPADCASFLVGQMPADELTEGQQMMRRAVIADLLMTIDPDQPGPIPSDVLKYKIPEPVIEDAMSRSKLGKKQFSNALDLDPASGSSDQTRCAARLALRQSILALPQAKASVILRDMEN